MKKDSVLKITAKDILDWVVTDIWEDDDKKGTILSMPTGIEFNLLEKALQSLGYEVTEFGFVDNGKKKDRLDIIWTTMPMKVYNSIVIQDRLKRFNKRLEKQSNEKAN